MKLPLQTSVSVVMLVATAGLAAADAIPPPLYYTVNPDTGESWQTDGPGDSLRSDTPEIVYNSLTGQDLDGDDQNFSVEQDFQSYLKDDYELKPGIDTTQYLITHSFRAGFTGPDGRLTVGFYDSDEQPVSSYLINLTGNEGFHTIVVSFAGEVAVEPAGFIRFTWTDNAGDTSYGMMETDPEVGFNDPNQIWDGVNQIQEPPDVFGGISMKMTTVIPTPGSVAPLALAGFGLLTRRRRS